jgi:predicted GNAT family acetyltransferase
MRAAEFIRENVEHFNGLDFSIEIEKDDEYVDDDDTDNQTIYVKAFANGRELGHVLFTIDYDRQGMILKPQDLEVDERFQGQGIAATMYDYVKSKGYRIRRSGQQTDAGAGFWNKHRPEQNVWEQGVAEGKKRRRRNRSFGGYWYPGYGYYGSGAIGGESGDGGGDGGGGESLKEAKVLKLNDYNQWLNQVAAQQGSDKQMASSKIIQGIDKSGSKIGEFDSSTNQGWVMQQIDENNLSESANNVIFISNDTAIVGQEHGKRLQLSDQEVKRVQDIAQRHGAWYEGNGMDSKLTAGIIDDYAGSWDDDLLSPAIKGYPAPFLYVLFSNIKENDTVEGKIGFDPDSTIFDRILDTQPSTNYFPDREFDAETLQKFLKSVSEGPYDFVRMSQAPATESNVRKFFTMGEQLMFPDNWAEYPYRAGRVAKSVNDLRDRFLATRKKGVYVAGSDHLKAVQQFLDQNKQDVTEDYDNTTFKIKRRKLNVPALIEAGAILITYPHSEQGWETDDERDWSFSLITLYNVLKGGWTSEAKKYLKPESYRQAEQQINSSAPNLGSNQLVYDGKYNQILWSIKKLGIPDNVAFLDKGQQGVAENFADGKVKGKSRPGRVKRAGASCNGSVTDLRKRAKNASGERAKMYHWCANMKSGRKK